MVDAGPGGNGPESIVLHTNPSRVHAHLSSGTPFRVFSLLQAQNPQEQFRQDTYSVHEPSGTVQTAQFLGKVSTVMCNLGWKCL